MYDPECEKYVVHFHPDNKIPMINVILESKNQICFYIIIAKNAKISAQLLQLCLILLKCFLKPFHKKTTSQIQPITFCGYDIVQKYKCWQNNNTEVRNNINLVTMKPTYI